MMAQKANLLHFLELAWIGLDQLGSLSRKPFEGEGGRVAVQADILV